nr:glycoside hydrolase family 38 C-terminal domain-containing protein [Parabacteroides sp. AF48-14]
MGNHPFTQTIRLVQGDPRIEMRVKLDWKGNPHIGEPGIPFDSKDPRKAFYDDRYKLLVHFPVNLPEQQIYKNAPFDVCESRLENTFFNRWDSIKNNLILNWVDLGSRNKPYGLALFTDHTTSYAHGQDFPLSLDLQYAGKGLWGRDYDITRPTEITYAIMPHTGTWEKSRLWTWSERRSEPLLATLTDDSSPDSGSFFRIEDHAYELVSMTCKGNDLYIRLFNAQGNQAPKTLTFSVEDMKACLVELDGRPAGDLAVSKKNKASSVTFSIPRYGIRTLKISDIF